MTNLYLSSHLKVVFRLFQISGWDELRDRLNMYMEQYNESVRGSKMDLVYFKDAMINLVKVFIIICKVLPQKVSLLKVNFNFYQISLL